MFQRSVEDFSRDEIGLDGERALGDDWKLKLIGLYREEDSTDDGSLGRGPIGSPGVGETTTTASSVRDERLGRLELACSGVEGHTLEFSAGLSENTLTSNFFCARSRTTYSSISRYPARTPKSMSGASTSSADSFRIGRTVDAALGAEDSRRAGRRLRGSARVLLLEAQPHQSYAPTDRRQWRVRAVRNVGQLTGRLRERRRPRRCRTARQPGARPETTTTVDLSYEVRGTGIGIGSLTLFHDG